MSKHTPRPLVMKTNWLDRRISAPGPHLCLCLSEREYEGALKDMDIGVGDNWIKTPHANATSHHIVSPRGQICIVCLNGWEGHTPIEIAGLLVHESVHAWQEWCSYYGESDPGREQEAYGVQSIAQELMAEFAKRMES